MKDIEILDALQGRGDVVTSLRFYGLKRNGYLLLALPKDQELAHITLGLYQPQSNKARMLVKGVSVLLNLGLHRLLSSFDMKVGSESALADLVKSNQQIGFLLGNAEAGARRAIVVYRDGNEVAVAKVGIGETAKRSVVEEAEVINSLPRNHRSVPRIRNCQEGGDWYYYSTSLMTGVAPQRGDDSQSLAVLAQWMEHFEPQRLRQTGVWDLLRSHARARGATGYLNCIETIAELEIKVGLYHGDFAPWNIKMSEGGDVCVLDWEHARPDGLAGWDWLHYMIQRATLVSNHSAAEVLDECRVWAATLEGRTFLSDAGWDAHIEEWLGSYLMYSSWIAGFEREELLDEVLMSGVIGPP